MTHLPNPFLNPDATNPYASEAAAPSAPQSGAAATHSNPDLSIPSEPAPQPAAALAPSAAGLLDDIHEIFYHARKLCAERQFTPDYPGIYQAMLDPSAPRALESDPVWADEAPLFLRQTG